MTPKLSVLMTTHNRWSYTERTLKSLIPTLPMGTQIHVFDNDSGDGTQGFLTDWNMSLSDTSIGLWLERSHQNIGWGAAVNRLMPRVNTPYILIANNDVEDWKPDWYARSLALYEKHPDIGLLAMWSHINHGKLELRDDLIVKDQMPAVAWLIKQERMMKLPEFGPCESKGGNGEDSTYCNMVVERGWKVAAPIEDFARHIDWY